MNRNLVLGLIGVMIAVSFIPLRQAGSTRYDPRSGIATSLPETAGPWRGQTLQYCARDSCGKVFRSSDLAGGSTCPACGAILDIMAPVERRLLPPDTGFQRMEYAAVGQPAFTVTKVLSGRDRSSIHRPEVCLGGDIVGSRVIRIPLEHRQPLSVRVLTVRGNYGESVSRGCFAYWFASEGHETASHEQRMWWMASDRVLHGVTRPWAYIAIAGSIDSDDAARLDELRAFVRVLHPLLASEPRNKT